jgi:hypothetical protein
MASHLWNEFISVNGVDLAGLEIKLGVMDKHFMLLVSV